MKRSLVALAATALLVGGCGSSVVTAAQEVPSGHQGGFGPGVTAAHYDYVERIGMLHVRAAKGGRMITEPLFPRNRKRLQMRMFHVKHSLVTLVGDVSRETQIIAPAGRIKACR